MLLQDHIAEHSPQRTQSRDTAMGCHATKTSKSCVQRLSSPILSTNPCLHLSTQRGLDPEQQSGTRQRTSQLEWTVCASNRPPLPVFLPKDAETVRLDHFLFAFRRFRSRHWRGCGSSRDVHVDMRHVLHNLLHRELGKSGKTVHTLNIPSDRGLRVCRQAPLESGHGSLFRGA